MEGVKVFNVFKDGTKIGEQVGCTKYHAKELYCSKHKVFSTDQRMKIILRAKKY